MCLKWFFCLHLIHLWVLFPAYFSRFKLRTSVYFYLKFLPVCSAAEASPRRRTGMSCFPACAGAWPGLWCGYPSRGPAGAGTPAGWPGTAPCGRRFPSHPCHLCRSGRCTTAWRTLEGRREFKNLLYISIFVWLESLWIRVQTVSNFVIFIFNQKTMRSNFSKTRQAEYQETVANIMNLNVTLLIQCGCGHGHICKRNCPIKWALVFCTHLSSPAGPPGQRGWRHLVVIKTVKW